MASMTDRNASGNNLVNKLVQAIYCLTATTTYTPGTGGGSAFTITPPFLLALMTAQGSNTGNGTEATTGNCPGYTPLSSGGKTLGSPAFGNPSAGVITNSNVVSYTVTGTWTTVTSIEIWDSAATKLRYLQGALTSSITGAANGDTVQFSALSISADASAW